MKDKKTDFKLMFGPSKPPRIKDEDAGIVRRLLFGRNPGKTIIALDEAVAIMK